MTNFLEKMSNAAAAQTTATTAAVSSTDGRMDAEATRAMAKALYEALLPAAELCTREMNAVAASQDALALKIDQLTAELERLSKMSHSVGLEAYTKKIQDARQRLNAVMALLTVSEQRIARMANEMKAKSPATAGPLLEEVQAPIVAAEPAAPAAAAAPAEQQPAAEAKPSETEEKKEEKPAEQ